MNKTNFIKIYTEWLHFLNTFLGLQTSKSRSYEREAICNASHIPPPMKLSNRYATEVDFQIYEMGPLAYYMADDFFIPNPPLVIY